MASSSSEATGGGGRRTQDPSNSEAKSSGDTDWAAVGVADGRSEVILIETFICVGVHTCAHALPTRERCVAPLRGTTML